MVANFSSLFFVSAVVLLLSPIASAGCTQQCSEYNGKTTCTEICLRWWAVLVIVVGILVVIGIIAWLVVYFCIILPKRRCMEAAAAPPLPVEPPAEHQIANAPQKEPSILEVTPSLP